MYDEYYGWRRYVSVAQRRGQAAREMAKLRKKGHDVSPVVIDGRTSPRPSGASLVRQSGAYSDYANRLPRGRTYVRNGSVVDLQITAGEVRALVSGSEMYEVKVTVAPVPKARWKAICKDCAGAIDSLVELLQGRFSKGVMTRQRQESRGLVPVTEGDQLHRAVVRTGHRCASTWRPCSTASARDWITARVALHAPQGESAGLYCEGRLRSLATAEGTSWR